MKQTKIENMCIIFHKSNFRILWHFSKFTYIKGIKIFYLFIGQWNRINSNRIKNLKCIIDNIFSLIVKFLFYILKILFIIYK